MSIKKKKNPKKRKRKDYGQEMIEEMEKRDKERNIVVRGPARPDEKLAAIVGSQPLPRSELTKKLWSYIKRHGCQDKKKRTMINADDSLRPVFNGKSQVSMFEMTKLVSKHLR
jgi:chromatin remodeling complex protein RSC6